MKKYSSHRSSSLLLENIVIDITLFLEILVEQIFGRFVSVAGVKRGDEHAISGAN